MKRHQESHLDHGLTEPQIDHIFKLFADRREFFKETIELPPALGTVPCGLWGPAMGDPAILNGGEVLPLPPGDYILPPDHKMWSGKADPFTGVITFTPRPPRTWNSRLIDLPMRPTRKLTIIAGPHEEHECILYTAYGGPEAPQEPTDPKLGEDNPRRRDAIEFWIEHALSKYAS